MLQEREQVDTPESASREELVEAIRELASEMPRFDRVAVGFPGVVRDGVVKTAVNLSDDLPGFDLGGALERALGVRVEVLNDADMHGYGAIRGRGVEMVLTLGTGFGTSLFVDGHLGPHLELAHHPWRKKKTYEDVLGEKARKRSGTKKWKRRVLRAIDQLRELTFFDHLYIGGGNARHLAGTTLPDDVSLVDNAAGILGGIRVFGDGLDKY